MFQKVFHSLNNEPCLIRPTLIDLNHIELNNYPLMINLDKCNGSCNVLDGLSMTICIPSEKKEVTVKISSIITRINEAKTLVKHISCEYKSKFISTTCNSNQK